MTTTVVPLTAAKLPAVAVSWKPLRSAELESVTDTDQRCVVPAAKVLAPGSVSFTLPLLGFSVTLWHEAQGVPLPGSPELPAGMRDPLGYASKTPEIEREIRRFRIGSQ